MPSLVDLLVLALLQARYGSQSFGMVDMLQLATGMPVVYVKPIARSIDTLTRLGYLSKGDDERYQVVPGWIVWPGTKVEPER